MPPAGSFRCHRPHCPYGHYSTAGTSRSAAAIKKNCDAKRDSRASPHYSAIHGQVSNAVPSPLLMLGNACCCVSLPAPRAPERWPEQPEMNRSKLKAGHHHHPEGKFFYFSVKFLVPKGNITSHWCSESILSVSKESCDWTSPQHWKHKPIWP